MKRIAWAAAGAAIAWLAFAPTPARPVAWSPPPRPSRKRGPYRDNNLLRAVRRIAVGEGTGPETILADGNALLTGYLDGRVVRVVPRTGAIETLAATGGRPLGLARCPDGTILVADARRGLLRIREGGRVEVIAASAGGVPFAFANSVAVDRAGLHAYFTDSSDLWRFGEHEQDILEHAGRGRLLRCTLATGEITVLKDGLDFPNGVALGPDDAFLVFNETGAYRAWRLDLAAPSAGRFSIFAENMPGFPDNLSFNGRDRFWTAFPTPRNPLADVLAGRPALRKAAIRARALVPFPVERRAAVCAYDLEGRPVAFLGGGADAYGFVTHAAEIGGDLYLGSLHENAIGVIEDWRAIATPLDA